MEEENKNYIQEYSRANSFLKKGEDVFRNIFGWGPLKMFWFFRINFKKAHKILEETESLYSEALAILTTLSPPPEIYNFHSAIKAMIKSQLEWISEAKRAAFRESRSWLLAELKGYADCTDKALFMFEREFKKGEKWFEKNNKEFGLFK